jgi:hypothetical protein
MCGIRQMGTKLVEQGKAQDQAAAPAPAPAAPAYTPGPYGPRTTVTNALPSTNMPNAGNQAAGSAAETLQIPAVAPKRSRGSYQTAGARGLNVPGVG